MQPGQQPVHRPHPALRRHHQIRPARRAPVPRPSAPAADSSGPHAVVPTATTRPPRRPARRSPAAPCLGGTANRSGYGGSCASAEATPVCSVTGANCTPRLTSSRHQPRGEGPRRARHLRAARPVGATAARTPSGTRTAAGPAPCRSSGSAARAAAAAPAPPRAATPAPTTAARSAGSSGSSRTSRAPPGQPHHRARGPARTRARGARARRAPAAPPPTRPSSAARGEVHHHARVPDPPVDRRGQRRRGVHHQHVPGPQQPRQLPEAWCATSVPRDTSSRTASRSRPGPPLLGRHPRPTAPSGTRSRRRDHRRRLAACSSRTRRVPPARRPLVQQPQEAPAPPSPGSGRAAIRRRPGRPPRTGPSRMSPGSTAHTRSPGSSTAEHRRQLVQCRLRRPVAAPRRVRLARPRPS